MPEIEGSLVGDESSFLRCLYLLIYLHSYLYVVQTDRPKPSPSSAPRPLSRSPSPGRFDPTAYVRQREERMQVSMGI